MEPVKHCTERKTLWDRYSAAFKSYVDAIRTLEDTDYGIEFEEAVAQAKWARVAFEQLWDDYCKHVSEHGCQTDDLPVFPQFSRMRVAVT